MVFDDTFSTVQSTPEGADPPPWWNVVDLEENILRIPLNDDSTLLLDKDWLSPQELEVRSRRNVRQTQLRQAFTPAPSTSNTTLSLPPPVTTAILTLPSIQEPAKAPPTQETTPKPSSPLVPEPPTPILRRSSRSMRGFRQSTNYMDEAYLSSVTYPNSPDSTNAQLTYLAELSTDFDTGIIDCSDPRAYAAKFKTYTPDNPSYNMAMSGANAHEWEKAMIVEIRGILKQKTWIGIDRKSVSNNKPILPGTWAFKLKRLPDGSSLKYKARYCVRGDKHVAGVDYVETYAPVVHLSTI